MSPAFNRFEELIVHQALPATRATQKISIGAALWVHAQAVEDFANLVSHAGDRNAQHGLRVGRQPAWSTGEATHELSRLRWRFGVPGLRPQHIHPERSHIADDY